MEKTKTLLVRRDVWDDVRRIMYRKTAVPDAGDIIYSFTADFGDGIEADIKVCNGESPYIDPVLFENGNELCVGEVTDNLRGTFGFIVGDSEYNVVLQKTIDLNQTQVYCVAAEY